MRRQSQIALFALICTGFCAASPAKPPRKPQAKAQAAAPVPVEAAPVVPPPPPPTLEQTPPSPPQVAMQNGLLSVTAENSMLGDVLNAVRRATGASMDVPPAAQSERVVVHLGPGEPRNILQQLLAGSKFDYIIVGSTQDPMALNRVVLTMRSGGSGQTTVANNAVVSPQNNYQPPGDYAQDEPVEEEPPQPEPASPEVAQPQGPQPPQVGPNQGPNQGPKTPEQLLQELQQMQQQNQNGPQRTQRNPPSPQ